MGKTYSGDAKDMMKKKEMKKKGKKEIMKPMKKNDKAKNRYQR